MSRRQSRYCVVSISDNTCADALTTLDKQQESFPPRHTRPGARKALGTIPGRSLLTEASASVGLQTCKTRAMARARRGC